MSDKLREAFERDVCKRYELKTEFVDGVGYTNVATVVAWEGFQAGHAHAMRGEKVYAVEDADGSISDANRFQPYEDLLKPGQRIVTYIRQEEE